MPPICYGSAAKTDNTRRIACDDRTRAIGNDAVVGERDANAAIGRSGGFDDAAVENCRAPETDGDGAPRCEDNGQDRSRRISCWRKIGNRRAAAIYNTIAVNAATLDDTVIGDIDPGRTRAINSGLSAGNVTDGVIDCPATRENGAISRRARHRAMVCQGACRTRGSEPDSVRSGYRCDTVAVGDRAAAVEIQAGLAAKTLVGGGNSAVIGNGRRCRGDEIGTIDVAGQLRRIGQKNLPGCKPIHQRAAGNEPCPRRGHGRSGDYTLVFKVACRLVEIDTGHKTGGLIEYIATAQQTRTGRGSGDRAVVDDLPRRPVDDDAIALGSGNVGATDICDISASQQLHGNAGRDRRGDLARI